MLWERNHIAAVGQGRISVQQAIDDERFRAWLAERSMNRLPASDGHVAFLTTFYEHVQKGLEPYVARRMPRLKIFRVIATLYPEAMTTVADETGRRVAVAVFMGSSWLPRGRRW